MAAPMALLYSVLWRVVLMAVHLNRAFVAYFRGRCRSWKSRLWERAVSVLSLPVALIGLSDHQKRLGDTPAGNVSPAQGSCSSRGCRTPWIFDARSLEKLPAHIGLLVAEEEPSYTDIAKLVVWCMAVGISYVSVYDNHGVLHKNNARLLEEIVKKQEELLGAEGSKYSVEVLSSNTNRPPNVLSCRSTVKVLSPEDGKQSIVEAAQQICRSVENRETTSKDISVSVLDVLLRESKNISDPDLVLKFGLVNSTLGFLPWHIRLTEFISLPSHRDVLYEQFLGALQHYSSCQQRLGQ